MMRALPVAICFLYQVAFPAFERMNLGSRSAAMGNSLVALPSNEWSAFVNPAGLGTIQERTVSLFYVPQPFEVKELSHGAATYVEPTSFGTFALSGSRLGFELYNETRVGLSYSNEFAAAVKGGLTVNYYSVSIQNYGSAGTFGIDAGLLIDISDQVRWGFAAFNLNAATIGVAKEKLPQVFSTGTTFAPVGEAVIAASIVKDVRFPLELHMGVEYSLLEMIALRAGTTSDPNTLNAGIGIKYSFAQFDYAFSSHNELGMTHQFSLSLRLGDL
ncbi:MAG: hypothetical protein ABI623_12105 [bacterium]